MKKKTNENTFIIGHNKQIPFENEKECMALSIIFIKVLLELKKIWRYRKNLP